MEMVPTIKYSYPCDQDGQKAREETEETEETEELVCGLLRRFLLNLLRGPTVD